ncbi:hypothetical protein ACFE04_014608 [Oxalis oulophora]
MAMGFYKGFIILVLLSVFQVGLSELNGTLITSSDKNFISWNDMKIVVDKQQLSLSDYFNRTRVIVVDQSGLWHSRTVQGAIDMVPEFNTQRVKIFILPGIYREKVLVPSNKPYISFVGNENQTSNTIITWNNKASDKDINGRELGTYRSASVTVLSDYFCATGITFENTVVAAPGGIGMQAVALRIAGDRAMFYKVRVVGSQDTLLDESGSHFFYESYVEGSIDFIFGKGRSLYQNCVFHSTAKRAGAIAAHHRDSEIEDTGFSFVNCTVNGSGKIYLGRAWGNYSRTIYSYCNIDNIITPSGWSDWNEPERQK